MKRIAIALISLLVVGAALTAAAQEQTEQVQTTPIVPFSTPAPLVVVTPEPNDARAQACNASTLPDFVPYVVRPGDTLADLTLSAGSFTVTQLAALNCIDDPHALPVGAVIWLPAAASVQGTAPETTPEATLEPTSESTLEATEEPEVVINRFVTSAEPVVNTDPVTFDWSAVGDHAYFYQCAVEECLRPQHAAPLPVEAALTLNGFSSAGTYRYRLDVDGHNGPVTRDVTLEVVCAQEWLGGVGASPRCPDDPALTVFGVWQPFEGGVMLWFSDVQQIYVMTNDGQFRVYEDLFVEGQPDPSAQPPSERFAPVRGFGQIWAALGSADGSLGWALTPEVGYDAARQAAGRSSYTTYIQGPGTTVYAITQLPGSEVGYWAQVAW